MRLSRREFLYLCGAGVGGLVTGCRSINPEPDYTVIMDSAGMFAPSTLIIPVGSMVVWHNRADHVHTVTADPTKAQLPERVILPTGATPFDSGNIFTGERWVHTFDVPGTYIYFCRYHELDEMLGAITVIS